MNPHQHFCKCADCSRQNEIWADAMLQRDPRVILANARDRIADMFAFGILHRAEQRVNGITIYPPDVLPQSKEPKVDPTMFDSRDLYDGGFRWRAAR